MYKPLIEALPLIIATLVPPLFGIARMFLGRVIPPRIIPIVLPALGGFLGIIASLLGVDSAVLSSYELDPNVWQTAITGILTGLAGNGVHQIGKQLNKSGPITSANGFLIALLLIPLFALAGCKSAPNPVEEAKRPEVVGFALYSSYTVLAETAATIAENPATPARVRSALIAADEKAHPVVKELRPLSEEVARMRAELAAGTTDRDKLLIAVGKLNEWITRAAPLIHALTDAIKGAK